jgi:excisionase family DNA binding protein
MKELIRAKDAMKRFSLSRLTLNDWVSKGWIKEYRTPGGHRRFDPDEITALLTRKPTEKPEG